MSCIVRRRLHQVPPASTLATESPISALDLARGFGAALRQVRTSPATTAKPRPCSPARAASTAAFSARMLVWKAMPSITPVMSAMLAARGLDLAHGLHHLAHHLAAARGHVAGAAGQLTGLACVVGAGAHGAGQLLHRRRGLLQAGGLLFGAADRSPLPCAICALAVATLLDARAHGAHHLASAWRMACIDAITLPAGAALPALVGQVAPRDAAGDGSQVGGLGAQAAQQAAAEQPGTAGTQQPGPAAPVRPARPAPAGRGSMSACSLPWPPAPAAPAARPAPC
jgi:hypothetical protein